MTDNANKLWEESIASSNAAPANGTVSANAAHAAVNTLKHITMHFNTGKDEMRKNSFEKAVQAGNITNPELDDAYVFLAEKPDAAGIRQTLSWLEAAYQQTQKNPESKVIIATVFTLPDNLEKIANKQHKKEILTLLQANPLVKFVELHTWVENIFDERNNISFSNKPRSITPLFGELAKTGEPLVEVIKNWINSGVINNPALDGTHIIMPEAVGEGRLISFKEAYAITNSDSNAKVVIASFLNDVKSRDQIFTPNSSQLKTIKILQANPNVVFLVLPASPKDWNNISFQNNSPIKKISDSEIIDATYKLNEWYLQVIRHSLQPNKVKDPYHPVGDREKAYVNEAFEITQRYFPGLDTITKMLDYVMHIPLDIPEPMRGKRVKGVYVDVDGTLIEYVPIGSDKEGKQELRMEVVELLKKYEQEWKEIIIWTGWDVKKKEKRLRELGITWPVVSKYDYAGATAEIVVDDTDKAAFMLQSKILPETYIDTTKLAA